MGPEAPRFYVIGAQGQSGPYRLDELREHLRQGHIQPEDRIRTPLGTPLGTVLVVLDQAATRVSPNHSAKRHGQFTQSSRVALIIGGILVFTALLVFMLHQSERSDSGARPVATDSQPSKLPSQAVPPRISSSDTSQDRQSPALIQPTQRPLVNDATSKATVSVLSNHRASEWTATGGTTIRDHTDGGWVVSFPTGQGGWIGIGTTGTEWSSTNCRGLTLLFDSDIAPRTSNFQFILEDGELYSSERKSTSHGAKSVDFSWTEFKRDWWQQPGTPNKGFKSSPIKYLMISFSPGPSSSIRIRDIRILMP